METAGSGAEAYLQYGAMGLLALLAVIAVRVLFLQNRQFTERETARADRNEEALRELNRSVQEKIIPAALEMVTTTKTLIDLIAQQQAERRRQ
jgi:hypothetical protein